MEEGKKDGSCFRDQWRDLVASAEGPPSATTRHVLLTLSLHMSHSGYCFPSTRLLAVRTGLSKRVVCVHLSLAVDRGWISKGRRQGASGQGWKRNEYQATVPEAFGRRLPSVPTSPPDAVTQGTHVTPGGGYPHDIKVVTQGTPNQLDNQVGVQTGENGPATKALAEVCTAMGVEWDHKRLTPDQWIAQKAAESRFAGLDFAAVFTDAADYLSSADCRKTYTSPTRFLLNQLRMAADRNTDGPPATKHARLRDLT